VLVLLRNSHICFALHVVMLKVTFCVVTENETVAWLWLVSTAECS